MPNDTQSRGFGERTLGEIAASLPSATSVFRAFKLDFCCGGNAPLAAAAQKRGLDPELVVRELGTLAASGNAVSPELDTATMISEILTRYHEVHRRELPELFKLACKVEAVHGDHMSAPLGLADVLQEMIGELEVHMKKEELILFPAMLRNASSTLQAPISQMRYDHDDHGALLRRLDEITHGFELPEGACRSWQALYAGTRKLADDLAEHIHLENNILFPRFEAER
jgi:regulator of cell morphogenesis and NO signaling